MLLLQEGVPAAVIDKAAVKFGMPMGPIELADTVGLDICLSVAENLTKYYGGEVPEQLRDMVKKGELGRKTGKGFYIYKNGKAIKAKIKTKIPEDVTDRLILRMVNEAVTCLREGVVQDADLVDAGMVFGTGFAPFRGGPIHYAEARGVEAVVQRLTELEQKLGPRLEPDSGWENFSDKSYIIINFLCQAHLCHLYSLRFWPRRRLLQVRGDTESKWMPTFPGMTIEIDYYANNALVMLKLRRVYLPLSLMLWVLV